jgi:hypothetical protein
MSSVLNIAGPEYDFGNVIFAVLQECEHRRRGVDDEKQLMRVAREKLAQIKHAYDEFGGSPAYWKTLEKEVLQTAMPQYIQRAVQMNALEREGYGVFRSGDVAARFLFAAAGLVAGVVIIALPTSLPIMEEVLAIGTTMTGFVYPDLVRFTHERRHARFLNSLVADAVKYQNNARLHYMSTSDIRESFTLTRGASASKESESTTYTTPDAEREN